MRRLDHEIKDLGGLATVPVIIIFSNNFCLIAKANLMTQVSLYQQQPGAVLFQSALFFYAIKTSSPKSMFRIGFS